MRSYLPDAILNRTDKMGFPVPLNAWLKGEARGFIHDVFSTSQALNRDLINNRMVLSKLDSESKYGRNIWGLLCLELWQQEFHDREYQFKKLVSQLN